MTKVVIRAVQLEGFSMSMGSVGGQYLASYDPEAHDGWGDAVFTNDIREALVFDNIGAAFEAWKSSPKSRPLRPDGQPNRPLSAFTITFEQVRT